MSSVVAIHGFLGGPSMWARVENTNWRPVTLPGHHDEPLVEDFPAAASWLADQLREPTHLVGYSMGARVALATAIQHPERVCKLTCIGSGVGLESNRKERQRWEDEFAALMETAFDLFLERWRALPLFRTQSRLDKDSLAAQDELRRSHDPERVAAIFRALALSRMPNFWPRLSTLSMPTQWIAGAEDLKYAAIAERAAAACPNGTVELVQGAGHNVVLERPDALRRLL